MFYIFFKVSCSFFVSVKTCEYLRSRIGFTGKITTERLYTINLAENKIVVQKCEKISPIQTLEEILCYYMEY